MKHDKSERLFCKGTFIRLYMHIIYRKNDMTQIFFFFSNEEIFFRQSVFQNKNFK